MVPVKVDIDALIEVSQLNTSINPHSSVATENLSYWFMILKMKGSNFFFSFFFFYQGFLSQTLTTHRTAGEGRGAFFILLYRFHPLTNIQTFMCNFACEMTMSVATPVFTRLILDEIYQLIEVLFD